MVRRKDPFWEYAKDLKNGRFTCNFCDRNFAGGNTRIKAHLSGIRGQDIQICEKVPETIQLQARDAVPPSKRAKNVAASNNTLEGKSILGSSSLHMPKLCEGQDKSTMDHLAKFFMSEGIDPIIIDSPFFVNYINGVAKHGLGYKIPYWFTIKSQLMPNIMKEVQEYIENVMKESIKTGCTLMYKRRWDCNKLLLDIYAFTPIGVVYIKTLKPSNLNVVEFLCFETTLSSIMEFIESTNVVQFIINDNGDYDEFKPTKDMCCDKYPWIYWTQCAALGFHIEILDDLLIGNPFVWCTIRVAKLIAIYIDKYKARVLLKGVHKKGGFIASDLFILTSLLEVESGLQTLQQSIGTLTNEWGKPLNDPHVARFMQETKLIDYAIRSEEFWGQVKMVAQVFDTINQAYYLLHLDGLTLGYLYEMIERVQDALEESNAIIRDEIREYFEQFRSDIIHPIHAAAAFLSPIYMCSEKFKETDEIKNGVNHILEHLAAVDEKGAFKKQEELYRMKDSNVFTAKAMQKLKKYHPRIWWKRYGNCLPILQKYAIRILSQPCNSLKIWDGYQLDVKDGDHSLFKVNTLMMEMYKSLEGQFTKPIIFDQLGEVSNYGYDWEIEDSLLSDVRSSSIDHIINDDMLNDPIDCSKLNAMLDPYYEE